MIEVKTALISVYKKDGVLDLSRFLVKQGIEIISTGGTAKLLKDNNIPVTEVEEYTQFPEMMDGRVKTLHPKIHAGILARRDNKDDLAKLKEYGIKPIDLVVVNLYPFQEVTAKGGLTLDEAIEFIDIGGPTMIRAAAKNYKDVVVVSNPLQYKTIIDELKINKCISQGISYKFAKDVFSLMSLYDGFVADYLENASQKDISLPRRTTLYLEKISDLRYGENSHQRASLYRDISSKGEKIIDAKQLHGKKLSFNNWLDLDAALNCVIEFDSPAAAIIKHNNPSGVAVALNLKDAFSKAYQCDSLSAFGGIVGLNGVVDKEVALALLKADFLECIIAPGYSEGALILLKKKKNLRILELTPFPKKRSSADLDYRKLSGGFLIQEADIGAITEDKLKIVTKRKPTAKETKTLIFSWKVVKNVRSNAIVLACDFGDGVYSTVGIGAGQASRVDSVIIAIRKADKAAKDSVLASDAFFPMPDSVEIAHKAGIKAIIQPGGSIKDEEVIAKADLLGIAMVFTGMRHFRH